MRDVMKDESLTLPLPKHWSVFQRWKNHFFYYCIWAIWAFFTFIPMCIAIPLCEFMGRLSYHVARKYRNRAFKHLSEALGAEYSSKEIHSIIKNISRHLGRSCAEALHAGHIIKNFSRYVEFEGDSKETYLAAIRSGKGVVFCGGHIGSWELFAQIVAHVGTPIWIVARKTFHPWVTRFTDRLRSAGGVRSLWRDKVPLADAIAEVLHRGEVMGFLIDQDVKVPGVFVPFFEKLAYTPSTPARLALKFDAALIVGSMRRNGKRHYIKIEQIDVPRDLPKEQAVYQITAEITSRLEQAIRSAPEQWVWMHRRWKTQPGIGQR